MKIKLWLCCAFAATLAAAADPESARLINLSTRARIGGTAGTPILGFVLSGSGNKAMLVRAIGPTLASLDVTTSVADPKFSLYSGQTLLSGNDNWLPQDASVMTSTGAFALPLGSKDAALVASLPSGLYTAPMSAADGGSGIALLEVYDASANDTSSSLINASVRASVGTGEATLILGVIVGGQGNLRFLIRAVGPSLAGYGVEGALADPTLTLYRGSTPIATNDNWASSPDATDIAATALAVEAFTLPAGSKDAALLVTLTPGEYTAHVTGVADTTGTALVELYSCAPASKPALEALATAPSSPTYIDRVWVTARVQAAPGTTLSQVLLHHNAGASSVDVAMRDDGLHGDGAAGDGVYGAEIPLQPAGATVNYSVTATDSRGGGASSGSASYSVSGTLADAIFTCPEFLGMPTQHGVTLNLEAATDLELYVEFGPASGAFTDRTPVATCRAGTPLELNLQSSDPLAPIPGDRRTVYRVRHRAPGETVFKSRGERSFQTQRGRGQSFTFTLTADPHLDEISSPALLARTMRNIGLDTPDFHVDLGDIFMSDKLRQILPGITLDYAAVETRAVGLRSYFSEFCHSAPFFLTLGNHEGEYGYTYDADKSPGKNNNVATWDLQARKLYYPTPVPDAFYTGSPETRLILGRQEALENYYAWEWGEALFLVLDPYWSTLANPNLNPADNWRWSLGKTQYDWLKQTLQASRARYKFVFIHTLVGGVASARGGVETAQRYEWGGKNLDGTEGFASHRPGWDMPIHQLLVANRVSAVFHGHDHLYACQQLDGIVYQECPQPGTPGSSTGSQVEGEYTTGVILPNSGHLRLTVSPAETKVEYIRAVLPAQETTKLRNRDLAHSYLLAPAN